MFYNFSFSDSLWWVFFGYLLIVNLTGFVLCLKDKRAAKKHLWRVPEKTFFLVAILGGSVGVLAGMYTFRHKTKHWYFVVGIPAILILEAALSLLILWKFL